MNEMLHARPPVVGLCGGISSGKSTVAKILSEEFGYHEISFADRLKELAVELFDLHPDQVHTQEGKASVDPRYGVTARSLLESLADLRKHHPDLWVNLVVRKIHGAWDRRAADKGLTNSPMVPHYVIPDVRYPNEFRAVRDLGGQVWRVFRHGGPPEQRTHHESDELWRLEQYDAGVHARHGDIETLRRCVRLLVGAGL